MTFVDYFRLTLALAVALGAAFVAACLVAAVSIGVMVARRAIHATGGGEDDPADDEPGCCGVRPCACGGRSDVVEAEARR